MTMNFKVEKFKCFEDVTIPLNKITVFCGRNGSGKSTLIQSMLLYREATKSKPGDGISLNGNSGLNLGSAESLLYQHNSEAAETIRFGFAQPDSQTDFDMLELSLFDKEYEDHFHSALRSLHVKSLPGQNPMNSDVPFFFTYLSAERNGPRIAQENFSDETESGQLLGVRGEYTAEILLMRERKKIRPELVFPFREVLRGADAQLLQATQDWLSNIVGEIEIRPSENGNAPPSLYFKRPGLFSEWTVSTNTGFGISYTLPIVVAGLLAPAGGFLIVDSPEAHLHPAAQTAVARFLAWVASSGVKVIIETHSDHIIDGLRLASVSPELGIHPSDCSILNIGADSSSATQIEVLSIGANGSLSKWPAGFFDQQTKNLKGIADAVRSKNGK
jgi:predicted ATPase